MNKKKMKRKTRAELLKENPDLVAELDRLDEKDYERNLRPEQVKKASSRQEKIVQTAIDSAKVKTKLVSFKFELDLLAGFKVTSKKKHLPYQTYIKTILYERLEQDMKAGLVTKQEIDEIMRKGA